MGRGGDSRPDVGKNVGRIGVARCIVQVQRGCGTQHVEEHVVGRIDVRPVIEPDIAAATAMLTSANGGLIWLKPPQT